MSSLRQEKEAGGCSGGGDLEIVANSDSVYQTKEKGCLLNFFHGVDCNTLGKSCDKKCSISLFVGDVIPIACGDGCCCDGEELQWPPSEGKGNKKKSWWYPFDVPWKVGQILTIIEQRSRSSCMYKVHVRWLHRGYHLSQEQKHHGHLVRQGINKNFPVNLQETLLLESDHVNQIILNEQTLQLLLFPPSLEVLENTDTTNRFRFRRVVFQSQWDGDIVHFEQHPNAEDDDDSIPFDLIFHCSLRLRPVASKARNSLPTEAQNHWVGYPQITKKEEIPKTLYKGWRLRPFETWEQLLPAQKQSYIEEQHNRQQLRHDQQQQQQQQQQQLQYTDQNQPPLKQQQQQQHDHQRQHYHQQQQQQRLISDDEDNDEANIVEVEAETVESSISDSAHDDDNDDKEHDKENSTISQRVPSNKQMQKSSVNKRKTASKSKKQVAHKKSSGPKKVTTTRKSKTIEKATRSNKKATTITKKDANIEKGAVTKEATKTTKKATKTTKKATKTTKTTMKNAKKATTTKTATKHSEKNVHSQANDKNAVDGQSGRKRKLVIEEKHQRSQPSNDDGNLNTKKRKQQPAKMSKSTTRKENNACSLTNNKNNPTKQNNKHQDESSDMIKAKPFVTDNDSTSKTAEMTDSFMTDSSTTSDDGDCSFHTITNRKWSSSLMTGTKQKPMESCTIKVLHSQIMDECNLDHSSSVIPNGQLQSKHHNKRRRRRQFIDTVRISIESSRYVPRALLSTTKRHGGRQVVRVGDVVCLANGNANTKTTTSSLPLPPTTTTATTTTHNHQNENYPWYPFVGPWSFAQVLNIYYYHDDSVFCDTNNQSDRSLSENKIFMEIRWLKRISELPGTIQEQLSRSGWWSPFPTVTVKRHYDGGEEETEVFETDDILFDIPISYVLGYADLYVGADYRARDEHPCNQDANSDNKTMGIPHSSCRCRYLYYYQQRQETRKLGCVFQRLLMPSQQQQQRQQRRVLLNHEFLERGLNVSKFAGEVPTLRKLYLQNNDDTNVDISSSNQCLTTTTATMRSTPANVSNTTDPSSSTMHSSTVVATSRRQIFGNAKGKGEDTNTTTTSTTTTNTNDENKHSDNECDNTNNNNNEDRTVTNTAVEKTATTPATSSSVTNVADSAHVTEQAILVRQYQRYCRRYFLSICIPSRSIWQYYSLATNLPSVDYSIGSSSWKIHVGDFVAMRINYRASECGTRDNGIFLYPYTVWWRPCQILAIYQDVNHTNNSSSSDNLDTIHSNNDYFLEVRWFLPLTTTCGQKKSSQYEQQQLYESGSAEKEHYPSSQILGPIVLFPSCLPQEKSNQHDTKKLSSLLLPSLQLSTIAHYKHHTYSPYHPACHFVFDDKKKCDGVNARSKSCGHRKLDNDNDSDDTLLSLLANGIRLSRQYKSKEEQETLIHCLEKEYNTMYKDYQLRFRRDNTNSSYQHIKLLLGNADDRDDDVDHDANDDRKASYQGDKSSNRFIGKGGATGSSSVYSQQTNGSEFSQASRFWIPDDSSPIYVDESSRRAFYLKMEVRPPYSNYCIRRTIDQEEGGQQQQKIWTVEIGDTVIMHVDAGEGKTYFEPETSEQVIYHKKSHHFPMAVPWAAGDIVNIWKILDGDENDDCGSNASQGRSACDTSVSGSASSNGEEIMLEIRWFYRKTELPGYTLKSNFDKEQYNIQLEEIFESDHYEDVHASTLLTPAILHSDPIQFNRDNSTATLMRKVSQFNDVGMPLVEFFCRRFWSINRRSLIPCNGLDGRIQRARLHSRYIGKDHVLREKLDELMVQKLRAERGKPEQLVRKRNSNHTTSSTATTDNRQETTLSTFTCSQQQRPERSERSGRSFIIDAFNRVISKLSLTDASKESSSKTILIGREKEQEKIMSFLRGSISNNSMENNFYNIKGSYMNNSSSTNSTMGYSLFVAGPPGVGKTACIRNAIAKLRREQSMGKIREFDFVALNGMEMRHPLEAYTKLWESIRDKGTIVITKDKAKPSSTQAKTKSKIKMKIFKSNNNHSCSAEEAAAKLEAHFTRDVYMDGNRSSKHIQFEDENKQVILRDALATVVLLDEIDYLVTQKQTVLYNFFDWPRRAAACSHGRRLIVIGVSNTLNLPERLQPRVQSRIGSKRCYFKSYNVHEINSILTAKIQEASPHYQVFDEDAIIFAARKTAAVSGDVRKAFHICKAAAERVLGLYLQQNYGNTITTDNIASSCSGPIVRIGDVQKVSRESFNSGLSLAVGQSTPFEALVLVSLGSLSRTTGRETGGFDLEELLMKTEAISGAFGDAQYTPAPTFQETLYMLQRMSEAHIVALNTPKNSSFSFRSSLTGIGGAWPIVTLLIDDTAILIALRGTKHSRLAEKYLARSSIF